MDAKIEFASFLEPQFSRSCRLSSSRLYRLNRVLYQVHWLFLGDLKNLEQFWGCLNIIGVYISPKWKVFAILLDKEQVQYPCALVANPDRTRSFIAIMDTCARSRHNLQIPNVKLSIELHNYRMHTHDKCAVTEQTQWNIKKGLFMLKKWINNNRQHCTICIVAVKKKAWT